MLEERLEAIQMRRIAALRKSFETIIQFLPSDMAEPIKELVDYLDCLLEFSQEDLDKSRVEYRALTDKVHALIDYRARDWFEGVCLAGHSAGKKNTENTGGISIAILRGKHGRIAQGEF
jgi:hypothetical protein